MLIRNLQDQKPKFGDTMTDFLKESGARGNRPTVVQALMSGTNAKYAEDIKYMTDLGNQSPSSWSAGCA